MPKLGGKRKLKSNEVEMVVIFNEQAASTKPPISLEQYMGVVSTWWSLHSSKAYLKCQVGKSLAHVMHFMSLFWVYCVVVDKDGKQIPDINITIRYLPNRIRNYSNFEKNTKIDCYQDFFYHYGVGYRNGVLRIWYVKYLLF